VEIWPARDAPPASVRLRRSGRAPLDFVGRLIARATGEHWNCCAGESRDQWFEISIFDVDQSAEYVVAIAHVNQVRGRTVHDTATVTDDPAATLAEYDPLVPLHHFPPGDKFAGRQAHLERTMREMFAHLVSDVLEAFPARLADADDAVLSRATRDARYQHLLAIGRSELHRTRFTAAEASLIADALNGTWLLDDNWRFAAAEVEDACRLNSLDRKWGVDGMALVERLKSLSPVALCALAESVEQFWRNPSDDMPAALRACGLLRDGAP
jgi:hypothetical protein